MGDVFVYLVDLPIGLREMVTPCADGYTIYIDEKLSEGEQRDAYHHALWHIVNGDFDRLDVQSIERVAHAV